MVGNGATVHALVRGAYVDEILIEKFLDPVFGPQVYNSGVVATAL